MATFVNVQLTTVNAPVRHKFIRVSLVCIQMESGSRFGSSLGLARRMERPRHLPARSLSSQQLGPSGSPSTRRVRQLLELGSRFNCPNPSPVPTPSSRHHRASDFNVNGQSQFPLNLYFLQNIFLDIVRISKGGFQCKEI